MAYYSNCSRCLPRFPNESLRNFLTTNVGKDLPPHKYFILMLYVFPLWIQHWIQQNFMENIYPQWKKIWQTFKTKKVGWTVKMWVTEEHTMMQTNIPYINKLLCKGNLLLKIFIIPWIHAFNIIFFQDRDSEIQRKKYYLCSISFRWMFALTLTSMKYS